ncbi:hypothetical protein QBC33DRAFT_568367 [Phialemonium atrogriseum]|uniref:Uncharacterized protein n=1 Tax=Phialemonium atrogriseum TaxID=1093897 RepID=A0AAJ0FHK6_9PEZI|nr:uncharacterized protein QBC33DRAFT_568367 [Phialemonium atrogriseum]KAK1768686.1 hypothetical protein QBC33DRAFT_568367 [Phialemonium atrogriseum]
MLLTHSQVSIAASSSIVLFFTAALFLSGFAIQQRTLRDLRAAIKPAPRPSPGTGIFLPDRFKQDVTELADGTVVIAVDNNNNSNGKSGPVVEVRPSVPEEEGVTSGEGERKGVEKEKEKGAGGSVGGEKRPKQKPVSRAERRRRIKEELRVMTEGNTPAYYQRRLW